MEQRRREFGIRLALGADPAAVGWLLVRQAATLVGAGLAIGLAGALALGRVLGGLLYGVRPADPATFAAVALVLVAVAACTSVVAARRATKVDPLEALRAE